MKWTKMAPGMGACVALGATVLGTYAGLCAIDVVSWSDCAWWIVAAYGIACVGGVYVSAHPRPAIDTEAVQPVLPIEKRLRVGSAGECVVLRGDHLEFTPKVVSLVDVGTSWAALRLSVTFDCIYTDVISVGIPAGSVKARESWHGPLCSSHVPAHVLSAIREEDASGRSRIGHNFPVRLKWMAYQPRNGDFMLLDDPPDGERLTLCNPP